MKKVALITALTLAMAASPALRRAADRPRAWAVAPVDPAAAWARARR